MMAGTYSLWVSAGCLSLEDPHVIMFARRTRISKPIGEWYRARRLTTTSLLSVYFWIGGVLYLFAVAAGTYRYSRYPTATFWGGAPAVMIGLAVSFSFLIGARLLWRRNRRGLYWISAPLIGIALQWFGNVTPSLSDLLFYLSAVIAIPLSWRELSLTTPASEQTTQSNQAASTAGSS